jgi:Bacterial SH3 domain
MSMIRKAASVVVVLCLSSASLHADSAMLTVSATSATVYKSPSVASPVVGHATRGAALEVTREVGDWVKVAWPSAPDGVGYVRTVMGSISHGAAAPAAASTARSASLAPATARAASSPAAATAPAPRAEQRPVITATAPTPARPLTPLTHSLGVGASIGGSTVAFGASARKWSKGHLGMQLEVSRYAMTSPVEPGRLTATQFGPSILYSMGDRFTDHMWMRPYAGVGVDWAQSTLSNSLTPGVSESKSTLGARVVVGSEFMFSNLPQLGVSLDGGYYHRPSPFIGYEPKGVGVAVSAHWYVK